MQSLGNGPYRLETAIKPLQPNSLTGSTDLDFVISGGFSLVFNSWVSSTAFSMPATEEYLDIERAKQAESVANVLTRVLK